MLLNIPGHNLWVPQKIRRLSDHQIILLEKVAKNPYLSKQKREELANQIGWSERGVYQWFRHKSNKGENQEITSKVNAF